MQRLHLRAATFVPVMLLLLGGGCGGSLEITTPKQVGASIVRGIQVTMSTTGESIDDSYELYVCSDRYCELGAFEPSHATANDTFALELPRGDYWLDLEGVELNCRVAEGTSREVTVSAGIDSLAYHVTCVRAGKIRVTAPTTGTDLDPNYIVQINGGDGAYGALGPNLPSSVSVLLTLPESTYTIGIFTIEANCTVHGPNPVTVPSTFGTVTDVVFPVSCDPASKLQLNVATNGSNLPPSIAVAYGVQVDPPAAYGYTYDRFGVSPNSNVTVRIPPGAHDVSVKSLVPNCTVSPGSVSFTLPPGGAYVLSVNGTCH